MSSISQTLGPNLVTSSVISLAIDCARVSLYSGSVSLYLDYASTTPPHPDALRAMSETAAEHFADPSRLYGSARRARILLDDARARLATALGGRPEEIVFTSGGTESCNLAVAAGARAAAAARKPRRAIVSAVEHTAVLHAARALEGFEVVELPVDPFGVADLDALRAACALGVGFVSLQLANPEVGTMQPVAEAAAIARAAGAIVHTDACAAAGNVPVDAGALSVDLLSASSHKSYGPKGAGLLWVRRGVRVRPEMVGDDRERGRRAGIENLPAIAGMAAAFEARAREIGDEEPRLRALTERLRDELPRAVPDLVVHGHRTARLPHIAAFSVLYVEGEALLAGFDARGIAVHSGSSCTSATQEPSHVLAAMGALTQGSIRVSLGRDTAEADVDAFLAAVPEVVAAARAVAAR
jgi:cysteine desulfurase